MRNNLISNSYPGVSNISMYLCFKLLIDLSAISFLIQQQTTLQQIEWINRFEKHTPKLARKLINLRNDLRWLHINKHLKLKFLKVNSFLRLLLEQAIECPLFINYFLIWLRVKLTFLIENVSHIQKLDLLSNSDSLIFV